MKNISITGASGHVGNYLTKLLIRNGYKVRTLVHNDEDDLLNSGAEMIRGNILDKSVVVRLCDGADCVFHLAAKISIDNKEKDLVYKTNVEGTRNIVDVCKEYKIAKLVHFSTIHALDLENVNNPLDEFNPLIKDSWLIYDKSKARGERLVLEAAANGLNAVIVNPTAVIGPYDHKPSYLGQAMIKMYLNKLPMLVKGGYNYVDVRDVAQGALNAALKGKRGERYILGGKWFSLKDLSSKIGEIHGRKTPGFAAPLFVAKIGLPFISAFAAVSGQHPLYTKESLYILKYSGRNISNKKAVEKIGFFSRPIEETLKDTFEWYEQHNLL
ncbi:MAG: NAD-dependent epimerase/dehydratase family protein [Bacteroidales bacterium]|nr:NAD-dependent epimerase/dehydratase family protein [Bacteroidales bacterium]